MSHLLFQVLFRVEVRAACVQLFYEKQSFLQPFESLFDHVSIFKPAILAQLNAGLPVLDVGFKVLIIQLYSLQTVVVHQLKLLLFLVGLRPIAKHNRIGGHDVLTKR